VNGDLLSTTAESTRMRASELSELRCTTKFGWSIHTTKWEVEHRFTTEISTGAGLPLEDHPKNHPWVPGAAIGLLKNHVPGVESNDFEARFWIDWTPEIQSCFKRYDWTPERFRTYLD